MSRAHYLETASCIQFSAHFLGSRMLVVGSTLVSEDPLDKMVDDVLANGRLEVVGRAGHSVMTDNPKGFETALSGFLLAEE